MCCTTFETVLFFGVIILENRGCAVIVAYGVVWFLFNTIHHNNSCNKMVRSRVLLSCTNGFWSYTAHVIKRIIHV